MDKDQLAAMQQALGLSDGKMAAALGVTRQSWRNWRTGRTCPVFVQNALRWMLALRELSPANDNLPPILRTVQPDASQ